MSAGGGGLPVRIMRGRDDSEARIIGGLHKYWARKPYTAIADLIARHSSPGDLVVDPFCGSGSMGLEAVAAGRDFIGFDLNPIACNISSTTLESGYSSSSFWDAVHRIEALVKPTIMAMYAVRDGYIAHAILGKRKSGEHNAVVCDWEGKNRNKVLLSDEELFGQGPFLTSEMDFPDCEMPSRFYKDRFSYKGIRKVSQFFTERNLSALAQLRNAISEVDDPEQRLLMIALSNTLLHASILKSENIRPLGVNNYWIPDDHIEENVWIRFLDRCKKVDRARAAVTKRLNSARSLGEVVIVNADAKSFSRHLPRSADYIITDPPYGDAIQYSELSFVWNCWNESLFRVSDEIIINPQQDKDLDSYVASLGEFVDQVRLALRPGGFFTLCFQNRDTRIWIDIIRHIYDAGFSLEEVAAHELLGRPYNQSWAKFSPKRDMYLTFRLDQHVDRKRASNRAVSSSDPAPAVPKSFEEVFEACDRLVRAGLIAGPQDYFDTYVAFVVRAIFAGVSLNGERAPKIADVVTRFVMYADGGDSETLF